MKLKTKFQDEDFGLGEEAEMDVPDSPYGLDLLFGGEE